MSGATRISASMLYNLVECPHRLSLDLYGNPAERDEISPFVQLLWEKGNAREQTVISELEEPFLDLSNLRGDEKERRTLVAMEEGEALIYSGRISAGDLIGEPDLLRREGGGYVAGDIKSGSGEEGQEDKKKPKKSYGVQLALYTDILEQMGKSGSRSPFVWDVNGEEVIYDLDKAVGKRPPRKLWEFYQKKLLAARQTVALAIETRPALSSDCKLCHWRSTCKSILELSDDLTLLPNIGRSTRDKLVLAIPSVSDLARIDVEDFVSGKKTIFERIGVGTLQKFKERAILATTEDAQPYLREAVVLPNSSRELFFDIEVDPMRDLCYLHGFLERQDQDPSSERYVAFFMDGTSLEEEERVFREAWSYVAENQPCDIYYYSSYEKRIWKELQEKYPSVCASEEVEELFSAATTIDLYTDVVARHSEWPTRDFTIKSLATFLGFRWRDTDPSGAASIEWYDRMVRMQDPELKQRLLDYNEDDCIATRVLADAIRDLPVITAN